MRRMGTVLVALGLLLSACSSASPASTPQTPMATAARFPDLHALVRLASNAIRIDGVGSHHVALAYSTTRLAASRAGIGANPKPAGQPVEVVVLDGGFICKTCSEPKGAPPIHGRVETFVVVGGQVEDFGVVNGRPGPQLGTGYELPVT